MNKINTNKIDDLNFWFSKIDKFYPSYFDFKGYYNTNMVKHIKKMYDKSESSFSSLSTHDHDKKNSNKIKVDSFNWFQEKEMMFSCEITYHLKTNNIYVHTRIYFNDEIYSQNTLNEYLKDFKKFTSKETDNKNYIWMLVANGSSPEFTQFELSKPKIDLKLNYGCDFNEKHDDIVSKLTNEDNKKGIGFFHGAPGTGKTTYIKYLMSILSKNGKEVLYFPNNLVHLLSHSDMLPKLLDFPNAVLILEDSESLIKSRDSGNNNVEQLLNISDGILSDILGMQIICTYNTEQAEIDSALLRKGRMLFDYEFDLLSKTDSAKLAKHLKKEDIITTTMSLADIYNLEDKIYEKKTRKKIGFN